MVTYLFCIQPKTDQNSKIIQKQNSQTAYYDPVWVQCIFLPADVRLAPAP